jgi:outer membrane protein OmpA-like peptidoglycan-associated protein
MIRLQRLFFLLITFLVSVVEAGIVSAPLQKAAWTTQSSKTACLMLQTISRGGNIGFKQRAGESLRFIYQSPQDIGQIHKADFYLDNAPWRNDYVERLNFQVFYHASLNEFFVKEKAANAALTALINGQSAVFQLDSETESYRISVLPIDIGAKLSVFSQCCQQLLPFNKEQLQGVIYFKQGSTRLNTDDVKRLKNIARLVKTLKSIRVVINSATSSVAGKLDKKWFNKRAQRIKQQLHQFGVPNNSLSIRSQLDKWRKNDLKLSLFGPDALRLYHYRKGSTRLSHRQKQRLQKLAEYIEHYYKQGRIIIASHTDAKGRRATNLKVSQRRGEEVKRFLIAQGVPEARIQVKAYGESRPIKSNRFPPGRAMNRRVEIHLSP